MGNSQLQTNSLDSWPAQFGHVPSLNGLRAFSILLVLGGHFLLPPVLGGIGAFGVTIFFFISGYLITRLLFAEMKQTGRIAVGKFYLRRLLRLYPVIVLAMTLCIAFALLRGQRLAPLEIASVFFYFTNYLVAYRELHSAQVTLPIGVFWSLSVEEHFYLLFPAGFAFFRGTPVRIAQLAVAVCVLCLVIRCVYLLIWPEWIGTLATYWRSETRFDSIAFGVLMAAACELPRGRAIISSAIKPATVIAAATAIVLSFAFRQSFYQATIRFTIQSLALFPVIGSVIFSSKFFFVNRLLNATAMDWIGKLSYSLYVSYVPVIVILSAVVEAYLPASMNGWAMLASCLGFAMFSYYSIERPLIKFRQGLHKP